ncbi:CC0125/CC1285 family lipoprotein [Hirschia litorea]|uniref:Lipoprotein n=1 Tax=Hirschia litorea TaxID=1199156 RepID=A0ABW2ILC4_9PROT
MRQSVLAILTTTSLVLAACASQPAYRPSSSYNGAGYSEQIIETNRYQVSFRGSSLTPRDDVETYLLLRSAELTLQNGYDYFVIAERDTESKSRLYPSAFGRHPSRYGFGYSYFHPRAGWYGAYDPFWDGPNYNEVTKYEATAEILMYKGEKPQDEVRAFDAQDVVNNVGPKVHNSY